MRSKHKNSKLRVSFKSASHELLLGVATGTLPLMLIVCIDESDTQLVENLASFNLSNSVLLYFTAIFLVNCALAIFIQETRKKHSDLLTVLDSLHRFTHELSSLIHSFYRSFMGAVLASIVLVSYEHGFTLASTKVSLLSLIIVLSCLFSGLVFNFIRERTKPNPSNSYYQQPINN